MMTANNSQRIVLFDALKLFAIFLVLWGHMIQHLLSSDYADEPVYRHIYSFHMPLFIMITGFFYSRTFRPGFIKLIFRRFRQLLLPAFVWTIIFAYLTTFMMGGPSLSSVVNGLIYNFWFLKTAFICSVICYPLCKCIKHSKILWGGVILILSQFTNGDNFQLAYMIPCFVAGVCLNERYSDVVTNKEHNLIAMFVFGIVAIVSNVFLNGELYRETLDAFTEPIWYAPNVILLRAYRIIMGISGSLFVILLFKHFINSCNASVVSRRVSLLGAETLGVYILQVYIIEYILRRHLNFDGYSFVLYNFVIAPAVSLVVLAVSYYVIKLLKHNRYLGLVLFGDKSFRQPIINMSAQE